MLRLNIIVFLLGIVVADHPPFENIFKWDYIDYNWPSGGSLQQSNTHNEYIAENNAITGIKLWYDKIYLTLPRWKNGVPVTLAVISATPINGITNPMLDPFPNWDMQAVGSCNAFQSVHSMEIDPLGRMWVLDTGRINTMTTNPVTKCRPRLVILDLNMNGTILRSHEFPNNVSPKASAYLNDIVLDHNDGGWAFITDGSSDDPGIIVYSLKDDISWKVKDNSMKAQANAITITATGTDISKSINVNGIAMSPPGPHRLLYYSPSSSLNMYSVPVTVMKNSSIENIENYVTDLGPKKSQSDGMVMTNHGVLYFGVLGENTIARWDSNKNPSFNTGLTSIVAIHDPMQLPSTFGIDEAGRLWYVTSNFEKFINNQVDTTSINYEIMCSSIGEKNYQYLENDLAPELPLIINEVITSAANHINLAFSTSLLIIVLAFLTC